MSESPSAGCESLFQDFERAWRRATNSSRPCLDDFVKDIDEAALPAVVLELVLIEAHWRRRKFGEHPALSDYSRFSCLDWKALKMREEFQKPPAKVQVPGYEDLVELDRGGMGIVYRAIQKDLRRPVALKMILHQAGRDELARFRNEAAALARLNHPNIVHIYAFGDAGGSPFFSMELVEGGNLAENLGDNPHTPCEAAELVETLARAVLYAHKAGIVHRDLKPKNVLLTPITHVPKIADFGLARLLDESLGLTQPGQRFGTPAYMAPEQAMSSGKVDERTDIWALGIILYELLTGKQPFRGNGTKDILDKVQKDEPESPRSLNPEVPAELEEICLKCLCKDKARRYHSAEELASRLRSWLNAAGPPSPAGTTVPAVTATHGPSWTWKVSGLLLLLLAAVFVYSHLQLQQEVGRLREQVDSKSTVTFEQIIVSDKEIQDITDGDPFVKGFKGNDEIRRRAIALHRIAMRHGAAFAIERGELSKEGTRSLLLIRISPDPTGKSK